ncbi:hypothetical protein FHS61_000049 [Altererythrobacter atlanticus]|uniref:Uncharacterized protein n=1 Tax=Croceibacterium atlanticum TaxID=1267766 RepID=A0A0F7KRP7_9SPHN|nr:hypothetical protein [Croceibacterium atlanticum]AKH42279.1 hypothetical protein WYH_01234 [Croceibacterium atlanticum]MBB5731056.1 hypothetical protein [Croceibacterium atlanticum]
MPERQSRHPDNDLIDRMQQEARPGQQSRSGGEVNRRVGTRAELNRATDPEDTERPTGQDNPAEDAQKGPKTRAEIQDERNNA